MSIETPKERAERERESWQYKCIAATGGNSSLLGTLVLAVIGRNAKHPPWIEEPLTILKDGIVLTDFVGRDYMLTKNLPICTVEDLRDNFRGLADHLKLPDDDREALFAELRKFIKLDLRADHDEFKHHS